MHLVWCSNKSSIYIIYITNPIKCHITNYLEPQFLLFIRFCQRLCPGRNLLQLRWMRWRASYRRQLWRWRMRRRTSDRRKLWGVGGGSSHCRHLRRRMRRWSSHRHLRLMRRRCFRLLKGWMWWRLRVNWARHGVARVGWRKVGPTFPKNSTLLLDGGR